MLQVWGRLESVKQSFNAATQGASASSPLVSASLLVLSYGLVLGAPMALRTLRAAPTATDLTELPPWALAAGAAGMGLGGIAVMVFVMLKVVRGMERHPYASVAPALGALLGVMLLGLDATVRVGVLDARALCFLCLVTSVLGGGLAQRGYGLTALLGIVVATLPSELVLLSIWAQSGFSRDVLVVFSALSAADCTFLAVLSASGVLLSIVAVVARSLAAPAPLSLTGSVPAAASEHDSEHQAPLVRSYPLPAPQAGKDTRERLARAMSLAIADLSRSGLHATRQPPSAWEFHDTHVERSWAHEGPRLSGKSHGVLVGSVLVLTLVCLVLGAAWTLAR